MEQLIKTDIEDPSIKEMSSNKDGNIDKMGPNSKRSLKKWSKGDDELLIQLSIQTRGKRWKWVASKFENKTDSQCRSRWERIKPGMKQGRWTPEEDQILLEMFERHGEKWSDIAKHLQSRTGKQVRDRFKNIFDPQLSKEEFTPKDDELVYKLYLAKGPKWKEIKEEYFPNRSADFIKNRFYSNFRKFQAKFNHDTMAIEVDEVKKAKEGKSKPESELEVIEIPQESLPVINLPVINQPKKETCCLECQHTGTSPTRNQSSTSLIFSDLANKINNSKHVNSEVEQLKNGTVHIQTLNTLIYMKNQLNLISQKVLYESMMIHNLLPQNFVGWDYLMNNSNIFKK